MSLLPFLELKQMLIHNRSDRRHNARLKHSILKTKKPQATKKMHSLPYLYKLPCLNTKAVFSSKH